MNRLADFMRARASETYPEPITDGHSHITEKVMPMVMAHVPPGNVLDVGCGQGPALMLFRDLVRDATGIALNQSDIEECRKKGFTVFKMDQNEIPEYWSGHFALVWARHVLEHSVAPFFTLHEFYRVLQPGGVLYVETPAPDTSCQHQENGNHYSVLTLSGWRSLIRRAGFEEIETREINIVTGAGPDTYFSFICRRP